MKRLCLFGIFLVGLLTCWHAGAAETNAPAYDSTITKEEALDIAESVFRYQFSHNASGLQQKAQGFFLKLFRDDPDADFLSRFKDVMPPVHKGTEFKSGAGLRFSVVKIKRLTASTVEVEGGYFEGGLSASGNRYTVEKKDGKWTVVKDRMMWIS